MDGDVTVEQSTDGAIFTLATIQTPITSGSSVTVVTDLNNGQQYWFRLVVGSGQYEGISNIATAMLRQRRSSSTPAPVIENMLKFYIGEQSSYLTSNSAVEVQMPMDVAPIIYEDRTLLPIRFVIEPLSGNVIWDPIGKKVTLIHSDTTIELWIGNHIAKVNGVDTIIDPDNYNVKPIIVAPGRTMLPLRFISEALGCTVGWDELTQQVTVTNW